LRPRSVAFVALGSLPGPRSWRLAWACDSSRAFCLLSSCQRAKAAAWACHLVNQVSRHRAGNLVGQHTLMSFGWLAPARTSGCAARCSAQERLRTGSRCEQGSFARGRHLTGLVRSVKRPVWLSLLDPFQRGHLRQLNREGKELVRHTQRRAGQEDGRFCVACQAGRGGFSSPAKSASARFSRAAAGAALEAGRATA